MNSASFIRHAGAAVAVAMIGVACTAPPTSGADSGRRTATSSPIAAPTWVKVSVDLPASDVEFPAGHDADLTNVHCLICHSAGMVLSQPALTKEQWRAEVIKMRSAFGALIPDGQVEAVTDYLHRINGR